MWRSISRGFLRKFNKSICFEKFVISKVKKSKVSEPHNCLVIKKLIPCTCSKLNIYLNSLKCKDTQHNKKEGYEDASGNIGQHSFFEAFGWSGAIVFCWAVSKHLWLSKKYWNLDEENKRTFYSESFIKLFTQVVKHQSPVRYVLPSLPGSSVDCNTDSNDDYKVDEELKEAAQELQAIHQKVIAISLNRRGISFLSKSTESEAIKCFLRASELKYPPASFNMGQCYELGIGAEQDFKQAAEWYKIASEQGHATAMYNLGVFYAHGWGGLHADIDCAKKLFLKAAKLGQRDALAALDQESRFNSNLLFKTSKTLSPNNCELTTSSTLTHIAEINIFVGLDSLQNGLSDDVFQQNFGTDTKWNVSLNSALAF